MKSTPVLAKATVLAGHKAHWTHQGLRCRLSADAKGVTVSMKGGNRRPGEPGEEFTFFKGYESLPEALAFVDALPSSFGPEEAERLGLVKTGWALYD